MISVVPLSAVPSQKMQIVINNQDVTLTIAQRGSNVYADISVGTTIVRSGAICLDRVPILQPSTTTFIGNLIFIDMSGHNNPDWREYGSRYMLIYYTDDEL